MKVSIITVSYNSDATIEETILSVLNQDYPNIEYIIIDGGSNDKTIEIVNKFENKIARFVSERDGGIYYALNKGIQMATGDIIGLLHSDDFYADKSILSQVVEVFSNENPQGVYGDLQYVNQFDTNRIIRNWKSGKYHHGLFKTGWMPPHPSFFVRRECYLNYGYFNTEFKFSADYELMLRFIHKHKIKLAYLPKVLVKMRTGGKSNVSFENRIKANREDKRAWKVNDIKPFAFTFILKPLGKLKQFFKVSFFRD